MWIQSQNLQEILEVKHIRMLQTGLEVRFLAKLDRETIILGTYSKRQSTSIVEDLEESICRGDALYIMPKRWEEE